MQQIVTSYYSCPCGELILGSLGDKLCLCDWVSRRNRNTIDKRIQRILKVEYEEGSSAIIELAKKQLDEYFQGKRKTFSISLLFAGTDFQKRVWQQLTLIPYGETYSYLQLAKVLGVPNSVRAVANANGANAISIFAACHRIIGSNGTLTGYAGGLEVKHFLLNLETANKDTF